MPRGKRKQAEQNSVHDRIRQAERTIATGIRETVHVSEDQLETVLKLIEKHGLTKAQVLRKAVRLGLEVLEQDLRQRESYSDEIHDRVEKLLQDEYHAVLERARHEGEEAKNDYGPEFYRTLDSIGIPSNALSGQLQHGTEGVAVNPDYQSPFTYEGDANSVVIE